jgi:hypothetical protein
MQVQFHLELMQGVYISGRAYQNAGLVPAHTRKPFTFQVGTTKSSAMYCSSDLEGVELRLLCGVLQGVSRAYSTRIKVACPIVLPAPNHVWSLV